jgi:hypothetical protein
LEAAPDKPEQQQQGLLELAQCKPITAVGLEPMELLVLLEFRSTSLQCRNMVERGAAAVVDWESAIRILKVDKAVVLTR